MADDGSSKPDGAAAGHAPGPEALRQVLEVLDAVVKDRSLLAQLSHEERKALLVAAGRTVHPDLEQKRRLVRSLRRAQRQKAEEHDRALLAGTGIREAREACVFVPPPRLLAGPAVLEEPAREVRKPRSCYVCKAEYRRVHFFYDALCPECAELNYEKRFQTADLHGRVAVVTGARVKIGYQAALKLLRAGATVVATTRFPHDAARRYAAEPDFADWSGRLHVHGLDLRHSPSVEIFCSQLGRDAAEARPAGQQRLPDGSPAARLLRAPARASSSSRSSACPTSCARSSARTTSACACSRRPRGPTTSSRRTASVASWRGAAAGPGSGCATRRSCRRCASTSTRTRGGRTCSRAARSTPTSSSWTCERSTPGG